MLGTLANLELLASSGTIPSHINVVVANSGPTPARITNLEQYARLQEEFSPIYDGKNVNKCIPGIIGPGGTFTVLLGVDSAGFTYETYELQLAELSVWGSIEYTDIFEHRHSTQFGYIYDNVRRKFNASPIHNSLSDWSDPTYED